MRETIRRVREKKTDLRWICFGTFLMALATNLFFTPADMVPGGFTGLAIIIRSLTEHWIKGGLPVWMSNIILNVPLILMTVRIRGFSFIKRTLYAAVMFSVFLYLVPEYPLVGEDMVLIAVVGGVIMGLGLGFVFQGKATTGGTDTLAALIKVAFPHLSLPHILSVLDASIILLSAWIFGISVTLYATISVFLTARIADSITSGMKNANLAYIISDHYEDISEAIINELDRGVTRLNGQGMYTGTERVVLMCAVSKKQTVLLRDLVYEMDPDAFMILGDASEIRGEGFLQYSKEEL